MKTTAAMFCDHASECPMSCPCSANCYCRTHTCKRTPRIADLEHVSDQSRPVTAHVVEVQVMTEIEASIMRSLGAASVGRYRWRCSCERSGLWKTRALQARIGGARHVAAMERGR